MLTVLLRQPTLHPWVLFEHDNLEVRIRALGLESDLPTAMAHRDMLMTLAPDASITVCHAEEEARLHITTAYPKPNLLLLDLCLDNVAPRAREPLPSRHRAGRA
jgi:hypothetical protein